VYVRACGGGGGGGDGGSKEVHMEMREGAWLSKNKAQKKKRPIAADR